MSYGAIIGAIVSALGSAAGGAMSASGGTDVSWSLEDAYSKGEYDWESVTQYERDVVNEWYRWLFGLSDDGVERDSMLEILTAEYAEKQGLGEDFLKTITDLNDWYIDKSGMEKDVYRDTLSEYVKELETPDISLNLGGMPIEFVSRPKRESIEQKTSLTDKDYMAGMDYLKETHGMKADEAQKYLDFYNEFTQNAALLSYLNDYIMPTANQTMSHMRGQSYNLSTEQTDPLDALKGAAVGGDWASSFYSSIKTALDTSKKTGVDDYSSSYQDQLDYGLTH